MSEWMALAGSPVTGFDTSRQSFIGTYGSYKEPAAVVEGCCYNSEAFGDNACGTLQTDIELAPGESKEILVMLGIGAAEEEGKKPSLNSEQ